MSQANQYKLHIEDDEGHKSAVPIELGEVSIGRQEGNTVRLDERNVSRRHARIVRENGEVFAEDLDSYNGIFVNGDRIQGRRVVHEGDLIRVGDFQLELRGEGMARRAEETTQRNVATESLEVTRVTRADGVRPATEPQVVEAAEIVEVEAEAVDDEETAVKPAPAASSRSTDTQPMLARRPTPLPEPGDLDDDSDVEARHEPTAIIRPGQLAEMEAARKKGGSSGTLAGKKAKLVCVSTQFAGKEFEIAKAEVVLGRTDDNDIAIDHRSVSRNHAKIVVAGSSFKIVDLGSANGTLVNGEEYAQAELKKGDLVELGHVKFRFVPPGETYQLTPEDLAGMRSASVGGGARDAIPANDVAEMTGPAMDAYRPTGRQQRMGRPMIVAGASAGAVVLVGVALFLALRGGSDESNEAASTTQARATATQPAAPNVADVVARAVAAVGQRQWGEAKKLADAALVMEPANAQAGELSRQATLEAAAQTQYEAALKAMQAGDLPKATELFRTIPSASTYATQAQAILASSRGSQADTALQAANRALEDEDWDGAEAALTQLIGVDPSAPDIGRVRVLIDQGRKLAARGDKARKAVTKTAVAQASPKPTPVRTNANAAAATNGGSEDSPPPPAPTPPPAEEVSSEALYQQALAGLKEGRTAQSIELLQKCIRADERAGLCYRALGIAYARENDRQKAARYYRLYLKVMPNAPDKDRVLEILKQSEAPGDAP